MGRRMLRRMKQVKKMGMLRMSNRSTRRRKLSRSSARLLQRRLGKSRRLTSRLRRKEWGQGLRKQEERTMKNYQQFKQVTRLVRLKRGRRMRSRPSQVECCSLALSSSTWTRTRRMEWRKKQIKIQATQIRMKLQVMTARRNLYQWRRRGVPKQGKMKSLTSPPLPRLRRRWIQLVYHHQSDLLVADDLNLKYGLLHELWSYCITTNLPVLS